MVIGVNCQELSLFICRFMDWCIKFWAGENIYSSSF